MGDKEKSEKKEKKDKKEKSEKKDNDVKKEKDVKAVDSKPTVDANLDQRKLFKEGQKQITPPVADATRGFYSSLLNENPNSKIAVKYAIEYGLLPLDEHNKLLKKYNKLKDAGEFNVATKAKKMLELKMKLKTAKGDKPKGGGGENKENKENDKNGEKKEKKDKE